MTTKTKITPKEEIANHLFEHTTSQFPSALAVEILERIEDTRSHESNVATGYNHEERDFLAACGITDVDGFKDKLEKLAEFHSTQSNHSEAVEFLETHFSKKEIACHAINVTRKAFETQESSLSGPLSELAKLLKRLKDDEE
jgi:hypothetical protein